MRKYSGFLIVFLLMGLCLFSHESIAQSQTKKTRQELEREKAEVQARLKEFDIILRQTTKTKNTTLGELNAITRQFQAQNRLVNTLYREVNLLNREI